MISADNTPITATPRKVPPFCWLLNWLILPWRLAGIWMS